MKSIKVIIPALYRKASNAARLSLRYPEVAAMFTRIELDLAFLREEDEVRNLIKCWNNTCTALFYKKRACNMAGHTEEAKRLLAAMRVLSAFTHKLRWANEIQEFYPG